VVDMVDVVDVVVVGDQCYIGVGDDSLGPRMILAKGDKIIVGAVQIGW
jgi:hypothetical protein